MGVKRKAWEVRLEQRLDEDEGGPGSFNLWWVGSMGGPSIYTDVFSCISISVIKGGCRWLFVHRVLNCSFFIYGDKISSQFGCSNLLCKQQHVPQSFHTLKLQKKC